MTDEPPVVSVFAPSGTVQPLLGRVALLPPAPPRPHCRRCRSFRHSKRHRCRSFRHSKRHPGHRRDRPHRPHPPSTGAACDAGSPPAGTPSTAAGSSATRGSAATAPGPGPCGAARRGPATRAAPRGRATCRRATCRATAGAAPRGRRRSARTARIRRPGGRTFAAHDPERQSENERRQPLPMHLILQWKLRRPGSSSCVHWAGGSQIGNISHKPAWAGPRLSRRQEWRTAMSGRRRPRRPAHLRAQRRRPVLG